MLFWRFIFSGRVVASVLMAVSKALEIAFIGVAFLCVVKCMGIVLNCQARINFK